MLSFDALYATSGIEAVTSQWNALFEQRRPPIGELIPPSGDLNPVFQGVKTLNFMQSDMGRQALRWGEIAASRSHILQNLRNEIRSRSIYPAWGNLNLTEALDLYCQLLHAEEDYVALILVRETYGDLIGVISKLEIVFREAYFRLGQSSRAIKAFEGSHSKQ